MKPPAEAVEDVIQHVAIMYSYRPSDLLGKRRHKTLVEARQVAYWIARHGIQPELSYPELGRLFSHRDHTTIQSGVRAVDARLATDRAFEARVDAILSAALGARGVPRKAKVRVLLETGT